MGLLFNDRRRPPLTAVMDDKPTTHARMARVANALFGTYNRVYWLYDCKDVLQVDWGQYYPVQGDIDMVRRVWAAEGGGAYVIKHYLDGAKQLVLTDDPRQRRTRTKPKPACTKSRPPFEAADGLILTANALVVGRKAIRRD
jgi:hypothetical protein